jgi:hypothetical protein
MTTRQQGNSVIAATTTGVQPVAQTAGAVDAVVQPLLRPDLLVKGNVQPKGDRPVQAPVSMTMTITLERGLTMVATEVPIDAGALAGARPPIARAVARLNSQPEVEAGSNSDVPGSGSSGGGGSSGSSGTRPDDDDDLPAPPDPDPDPEPEAEIYATRVADLVTGPDGSFEYAWDPRDAVRDKLTSRVVCRVEIQAHVPGAHLRKVEATAWDSSSDDVVEALNAALSDITYKIDFDELQRVPVVLFLGPAELTEDYFDDDEFELELRYSPANPVPMPLQQPLRFPAPVQSTTPLRRTTDTFFSGEAFAVADADAGEYHYEVRGSENTRTAVRTAPIPAADVATNTAGYVEKLVIEVGAGTVAGEVDEREFNFPWVIKDIDVDLVDDAIRVRGTAAFGTGINAAIASIASFDVEVGLTLLNRSSLPYTEPELASLFDVVATSTQVDAMPGTDVDELPAWFWIALAPLAPALSGWAAIVAGIEAIVRPIARNLVEERVATMVAAEASAAKNREWQEILDTLGDISDQDRALLDQAFWFETDTVTIDPNAITLTGFGGVWAPATLLASLAFS